MEKSVFKMGDLVNVKGCSSGVVCGASEDVIEVFIGDKVKKFKIDEVSHEENSATISLEAELELRKKWEQYMINELEKMQKKQ